MNPMSRLGIAMLVVSALVGCAQAPSKTASLPKILQVIDDVAAENGDRIVITRDYVDEVKIDGKDVRQRYQYAWNYTRAVAQLRVFALSGELLQVEDRPGLTLRATDAEQAYAFSAVRADPRFASMHRPDSTFYGGFRFRPQNHPVCDRRARCIHVFASDTNGNNTTLHVIFDLTSGYSEVADELADPSRKLNIQTSQEALPQ